MIKALHNPLKIIHIFIRTSLVLLVSANSSADSIRVAVAASFVPALQQLSADFTQRTGHQVQYSAASSAVLYAQIKQGAPFDLFLSADQYLPQRLYDEGLADKPIYYAQGQLVLWQRGAQKVALSNLTGHEDLVLANPKLSPYGAAAKRLLEQAQLWPWRGRLMVANNISQALLLTEQSGALGFAAFAQFDVLQKRFNRQDGAQLFYDYNLTTQQYMAQLNHSQPVLQFWHYLQSAPAQRLIEQAGYNTTPDQAQNMLPISPAYVQ